MTVEEVIYSLLVIDAVTQGFAGQEAYRTAAIRAADAAKVWHNTRPPPVRLPPPPPTPAPSGGRSP